MKPNRRQFIFSTSALLVLPTPSIAAPIRAPFVNEGMMVSFLYFEDWTRPSQPHTIDARVERLCDWDGDSYPITLSYNIHREKEYWDGIDAEWCCFREEVPNFSWKNVSSDVYPNIHSYVRERRFGEEPGAMALRMDVNQTRGVPEHRGLVPVRSVPAVSI